MSKVKGEQLDLTEAAITRWARQAPPPVQDEAPAMDLGGTYGLIMRAVSDPQCDPAKLRELLAVRREWNADEAAADFNAAVVRFQQECTMIVKGDDNRGKKYAKMERIWPHIKPLLKECGLAITWGSCRSDNGVCIIDGHIRHVRGHAEPVHYELPIPEAIMNKDGKAVQNAAQVMGSATTYAKRYGTCAVLGIQTFADDDGNGGEPVAMISARDSDDIAACLRDMPKCKVDEFWLSLDKGSLAEMTAAEAAKVLPWCRKCVREAKANG